MPEINRKRGLVFIKWVVYLRIDNKSLPHTIKITTRMSGSIFDKVFSSSGDIKSHHQNINVHR